MFFSKTISDFFYGIYRHKDTWILLGVLFSILFALGIILSFFRRKRSKKDTYTCVHGPLVNFSFRIFVAIEISKMISDVLSNMWSLKITPFAYVLVCALFYYWFTVVARFIKSIGVEEYRALLPAKCADNCTDLKGKRFKNDDECTLADFACLECPSALCLFYEYRRSADAVYMHRVNEAALVVFLNLARNVWQMHVTAAFVVWYWEVGASSKKICRKSLAIATNSMGVTAKGSVLILAAYVPNYFLDRLHVWRARRTKAKLKTFTLYVARPIMGLYDKYEGLGFFYLAITAHYSASWSS